MTSRHRLLARILVDHKIVHRSEVLSVAVINRCADGLVGRDEGSVSSVATVPPSLLVCILLS